MSANSNFEKRYGALMRSVKRREVELAEEAAVKAADAYSGDTRSLFRRYPFT